MPDNDQTSRPAAGEPSDDQIKLMSVQELCGKKFFIPGYQRGYRWTEQQVKDLLNDIWEFQQDRKQDSTSFYCLQPLVVTPCKIKKQGFNNEIDRLNNLKDEDDICAAGIRRAIDGLTQWEVIDGQQRLTTIKIILAYLNQVKDKDEPAIQTYSIEYQTREQSKNFLDNVATSAKEEDRIAESNIDFYHMWQAYWTINDWFGQDDPTSRRNDFTKTLLENVQFIWYEAKDEDPVEVFTRLNIGKIGLTNAELIKALFLNRSNWGGQNHDTLALSQLEIASQWDNIEYTLQNDEFWMFFHAESAPSTRIDYIFEYICDKNLLYKKGNDSRNDAKIIGSDRYRTFRYFYNYFKTNNAENVGSLGKSEKTPAEACWEQVKRVFGTLQEWYNDCEMYHYIGFLVAASENNKVDEKNKIIHALLSKWLNEGKCKKTFLQALKENITQRISDYNDLTKPYDDGITPKSKVVPLLLLFNVQSVITQNKGYGGNQQYNLGVFYKFPFHLYKKEKWDIEHIDSNTPNEMDTGPSQKEWILNALLELYYREGTCEISPQGENEIITVCQDGQKIGAFDLKAIFPGGDIYHNIIEFLAPNSEVAFDKIRDNFYKYLYIFSADSWGGDEKNQVWNFALLDSGTNRSYHNDLFPTKRRKLIAKDQGKRISLEWNPKTSAINITISPAEIAFVPPCTRNVFLKYYTPGNNDIWSWNRLDAENYRKAIYDTLKEFGVHIGNNEK